MSKITGDAENWLTRVKAILIVLEVIKESVVLHADSWLCLYEEKLSPIQAVRRYPPFWLPQLYQWTGSGQ